MGAPKITKEVNAIEKKSESSRSRAAKEDKLEKAEKAEKTIKTEKPDKTADPAAAKTAETSKTTASPAGPTTAAAPAAPTGSTAPAAATSVPTPSHPRQESDLSRTQALNISDLQAKTIDDLCQIAKDLNVASYRHMHKDDLIFRIMQAKTEQTGLIFAKGVLEILPDGYGFLRTSGYLPSSEDIYVSQTQIRRFDLSTGDSVYGQVRPPKEGEKYFSLLRVEAINNVDPETARQRIHFDNLVPLFPDKKFTLETEQNKITPRLIDLISPIGKGQRGLIVSPPKAGKTTILKEIANAIATNYPNAIIKILLVDERPEEVTDMARSVKAEVISSTFDEPPEQHVRITDLVSENSKRLVEAGQDVVILLDSITRLARAHNVLMPSSGRTLSGGLDTSSLRGPKRFFGAARNTENGGSLTIIATALVDTGSRMDDVIYEEFKGTGNWEIHLDRHMSDRRIFPAIDIRLSGTRKEELLLTPEELQKVWLLRKVLDNYESAEASEQLINRLRQAKSNKDFLDSANVR